MVSLLENKIILAAIGAFLALVGCGAEHTNHWDTISARTGNAHEANTAIQEVTAWPRHVENTTILGGN